MKKIVLIIFTSFLIPAHPRLQNDSVFSFIRVMKGSFSSLSVDNLDNLYVFTGNNQLKKFSAAGDSVAVFNDVKNFGVAGLIDVSNPLKVLLYYQDFNTIVMLDRLLNIRNSIDLRQQDLFQVHAIGQSYDNKVWVFDELENKLKKIDENGKLLLETPDLRLLVQQVLTPVRIFDENKLVYVYDPLQGVYVFDYYGALKNSILITGWNTLKVVGKYIFGSKGDTLFRYSITDFNYEEWKLPADVAGSRAFDFSNDRFYALRNEGIYMYEIKR